MQSNKASNKVEKEIKITESGYYHIFCESGFFDGISGSVVGVISHDIAQKILSMPVPTPTPTPTSKPSNNDNSKEGYYYDPETREWTYNEPDTPSVQASVKISATNFYNEYNENSIAANKKYKGAVVQIYGTVGTVAESFGSAYVTIDADEWGFSWIQCYFKNSNDLVNVKKGQSITIQGTVGSVIITAPTIDKCTIVN